MTGWSISAQRALAHAIVRFMPYCAKTMLTPRGKVTSYKVGDLLFILDKPGIFCKSMQARLGTDTITKIFQNSAVKLQRGHAMTESVTMRRLSWYFSYNCLEANDMRCYVCCSLCLVPNLVPYSHRLIGLLYS
jgi:hypothetical protein